jgi:hypothetical protein
VPGACAPAIEIIEIEKRREDDSTLHYRMMPAG